MARQLRGGHDHASRAARAQALPHVQSYTQERTPDFSDLRNKIAEVDGEKKKLRERKNSFAAKLDNQ
jgi:hypothetical protein